MEKSIQTKNLIELGNTLIKEYGLNESSDILSKWMLHFLAELFEKYNQSDREEKNSISIEIKETILKLWSLRYERSYEKGVFKNVDSLLETLDKLKCNNDNVFISHFISPHKRKIESAESGTPDYWYSKALNISESSKILIRDALIKGYGVNYIDNQEVAELVAKLDIKDTYQIIFNQFYEEEQIKDNDIDQLKMNISRIDDLILGLTELKKSYEKKLVL